MLTFVERIAKNDEKIALLEKQQKELKKQEKYMIKRINNKRNFVIGELFCKHFPATNNLIPGTKEQNVETFKALDVFFSVLSQDKEILRLINEKLNAKLKTYQPIHRSDLNGNNQPFAQHSKPAQLLNKEVKDVKLPFGS